MSTTYSVAISYKRDLGWIDYDAATKTAEVHIANEEAKQRAENYLHTVQIINVPHKTLMDFTQEQIDPLATVENFKLALTRLWGNTDVQVDWSRPVNYVKEHPVYDEID